MIVSPKLGRRPQEKQSGKTVLAKEKNVLAEQNAGLPKVKSVLAEHKSSKFIPQSHLSIVSMRVKDVHK